MMQAASPIGRSSKETVTWVPRLGLILGISSSVRISSVRIRSAQTPVALTTLAARTSNSSPDSASGTVTPVARPSSSRTSVTSAPLRSDGAEALGLAEDRQDQAHVVGLAVVEEVGAGGVARRQRRDQLGGLLAGDRAVAVGVPVVVLLAQLGLLAPLADPGRRHHVVEVEPGAERAAALLLAEGRDQERRRVDEVRRQVDHQLALEQRLADQPEVEVLQVAEPAVDHLRGAARGALRVVAALDQRHRVAARGGVERDAGAGDPAADHDDVELVGRALPRARRREITAWAPSVEELDRFDLGRALGRPLLLDRVADVEEADEALVVGQPDRGAALGRAQHLGRAPVARQAAGVGGEQDDVGGDRGRVQVLLVLDRVAAERRRADDQGRGAVELRRRLGAGGLLQALERPGPMTRKRQGSVRLWFGAQRASSNSSSSVSRSTGSGS